HESHSAAGWPVVHCGPRRQAPPRPDGADANVGEGGDRWLDITSGNRRWAGIPAGSPRRPSARRGAKREVDVARLLVSGEPQSWGPDSPRKDRDVNADIFPKDEYYRNRWKLDLIEDRTPRATNR